MAQGFDDFSGPDPLDNYTPEVNSGAEITADPYLRLTPTERWQSVVSDLAGTVSAPIQVMALMRCSEGLGFRMGAGPHAFNGGGVFNLYMASLGQNIERQLTYDVSTELAAANFTDFRNAWVWNLLQIDESGNVNGWFWDDGDTPKTALDTPNLTVVNTTRTSGNIGISMDSNNLGVTVLDVAYFSWGTNGDAAPLPSVGGSTYSPIIENYYRKLLAA